MNDYLKDLQAAIGRMHGCDSKHVASAPVIESFRGKIVWQGRVEVFDLLSHPKARRCYAWSHQEGDDPTKRRYVAVLQIPPVNEPLDAVRAFIASQAPRK